MRIKSICLFAFALAATVTAHAQQDITPIKADKAALSRIAVDAEKDFKANYSKALVLAKQHGWVVEKTYSDGSHVSLQGIDSQGLPIYYITYNNSRAAATTRTNQVWAGGSLGLNLSGAGISVAQKLAMWDGGGVRRTHQELRDRVIQKDNLEEISDHATHVAGTLIATGLNPLAKGMAFGVTKLAAYDFTNDVSEMAAAAPNLLVSNHSYGSIAGWRYNSDREGTEEDPYWEWWGNTDISKTEDYRFGYYDDASSKWDHIAFNAPYYLIVKSVGNNRSENGPEVGKPYFQRNSSGKFDLVRSRPATISNNNSYDIIPTYGTAKNVLTVGAVEPISNGYAQNSDVRISIFSAFGPTDDGRIKPDIVGNGVSVLSSSSDNDRAYKTLNGTSMATPNVAGSMLLLQEHYSNLNNGGFMRAATLKGVAIHTADEAGDHLGPDYRYGWGLLNVERAASFISTVGGATAIQERSLAQGQSYSMAVVASGASPLTVTLSWTDPEATAVATGTTALNNRTPKLVNDLDVRLYHKGTLVKSPWVLTPLNPAAPAQQGDNVLDNVEKFELTAVKPGETYTVVVTHKGTLQRGPQQYSLLLSGIGGSTYCASNSSAEQGAKVQQLSFAGFNYSNTQGCGSNFQDQTAIVGMVEPNQTLPVSLNVGFCNGTPAPTALKAFADWNNDGDFDDEGEELINSGVLDATGNYTGTVQVPSTAVPGQFVRARFVAQETSVPTQVSACGTYARGGTVDFSLRVVRPSYDVEVSAIVLPPGGFCVGAEQNAAIRLRNNGTSPVSNVPVTITVSRAGTETIVLNTTFTGTLSPYTEGELAFSLDAPLAANATYSLEASTSLPQDARVANNNLSQTFEVGGSIAAPTTAAAFRCGSAAQYTLSGEENGTLFWYDSPTATRPIAAGNLTQIPASPQLGSTLYAALNDYTGTIGPATKNFASDGGYNQFTPSVLLTAKAPMLLESARLYIGHEGKITFTVINDNGAPVSSRTLYVQPTRTTPAAGNVPNDPNDQGAVYYLGLEIPAAGDYSISIAYENGATIFRNNSGVAGYPFGLSDVLTITGTTANPNPQSYYYYFYDLKVRGLGCQSPRVAVNIVSGQPINEPTISRNGQTLVSSYATGNQWYLDNRPIAGATGQVYTPTESGNYSVMVVKDGCISDMAMTYTFSYKPGIRELGPELVVSPNPSSGRFRVEVETSAKEDITFEVTDLMGKILTTGKVTEYYGQYEGFINLSDRANGVYILRVRHGDKSYSKKLLVQH
ncbi:S8 family serine peptidase [Pontibacter harenae]|uniref:S8 family serine peptidase n=1 Tax=Pontibacter harenae TaxID=2894083 RepID=UPI001E2B4A77|nr:S8 family serine peptidase [Pontibacter harenae]MCC9166398.1 S8 family serine peptidase [Pontibacter harenae]